MSTLQFVSTARAQLVKLGHLVETIYVAKTLDRKSLLATVTVSEAQQRGHILFRKTVDLRTGKFVRGGNDLIAHPEALKALEQHYNDDRLTTYGLINMQEFCADYESYPTDQMPYNNEYGQCVYFGSRFQLYLDNDGYIAL